MCFKIYHHHLLGRVYLCAHRMTILIYRYCFPYNRFHFPFWNYPISMTTHCLFFDLDRNYPTRKTLGNYRCAMSLWLCLYTLPLRSQVLSAP